MPPGPQRKKAAEAAFSDNAVGYLDSDNIFRLGAFLALGNGELNLLAFGQGLEATALNGTEVNEDVGAAFTSNETKAFCFVEELDGTGGVRHIKIS
jgi:hypothetical protein